MSLRGLVSGREELLTVGLVTTRSWARGKVRVCVKSRIVRVAARGRLAVSLYLQSICADDECCCYLFWVSRGEVIKSVVPQFPGPHHDYPPHPRYPGPSHHLIDTLAVAAHTWVTHSPALGKLSTSCMPMPFKQQQTCSQSQPHIIIESMNLQPSIFSISENNLECRIPCIETLRVSDL